MLRILPVVALLAATACAPEQTISGREAYEQDCAACHGVDAKGGGSFGRQLITVPPDLTGLSADNGGVFPLDYVMSTIDGLHRDEGFSMAMPEFGAGDMGETVMVGRTPVPARLLALAGYLESLQE